MIIQIQGNGEVHGRYRAPETNPSSPLTADEFSAHLAQRLMDETAVGRIESIPITTSLGGHGDYEPSDRVIVNIDELNAKETFNLAVIHEAVGLVSVEHLLPPIQRVYK